MPPIISQGSQQPVWLYGLAGWGTHSCALAGTPVPSAGWGPSRAVCPPESDLTLSVTTLGAIASEVLTGLCGHL